MSGIAPDKASNTATNKVAALTKKTPFLGGNLE
jgi:hypothetical protein